MYFNSIAIILCVAAAHFLDCAKNKVTWFGFGDKVAEPMLGSCMVCGIILLATAILISVLDQLVTKLKK